MTTMTTQEERFALFRQLPDRFLVIEEHISGFGRGQCSLAQENGASAFKVLRSFEDFEAEALIDMLKSEIVTVRNVERFTNGNGYQVSLLFYSKIGGSNETTSDSSGSCFADLVRR